ncbi:hypothetical protein FD09_GL002491 [Schleiferilactobacillus perolens DSM 12744]|uniref:Uncharacterized protein n=1 Tax=Schleiferilactobacillus perolens DSM 12744 TaxID=1423792 RepID=A0A0R1MXP4_9LACO|nr:hypothetical protein FD09_GL002491 [Schleiferilactobacillus perolens DSM 12744]
MQAPYKEKYLTGNVYRPQMHDQSVLDKGIRARGINQVANYGIIIWKYYRRRFLHGCQN